MPLDNFHPAVADWFQRQFDGPSNAQVQAWPAIQSGQNCLIAAPTGSGKTLAAFLAVIDQLVKQGDQLPLPNETRILYVSPLKALSNDIHKNLQQPLEGIRNALFENGVPDIPIRAQVRTGDTSQAERQAMKRNPPHILVTTPESLYVLLTSDSGREILRTVSSVIIDEIHALAGNKRGAHLLLSLQRLNKLTERPPVRIGLSATQKPIENIAHYLFGHQTTNYTIVDTGHVRERDLALEITPSPLEAIMANEVWGEIYERLEQLIEEHRTTLIFVNTRRLTERASAALAERLGDEAVTAHHGSLAKEHRLDAETRLKEGKLRALVATASLELGIDIGDVDLVCQLGSPGAIATFLQRVGRSGHYLGGTPKGRLFPLTRDDLVECTAMLDAIRHEELDRIIIPEHPLDVLAQHIVAEVASGECNEKELYELFQQAWPYRQLTYDQFTDIVKMLAEGYSTRMGRRGAYLHRDAVNGVLRARKGARLTALTNGGAIPDQFDYDVILQPEGLFVGTLNEDFAFESLPGDIFQLGNTCYRMLKIEQGRVLVEDAQGLPPNIPFWFGEAPGRTDELSLAVSNFREKMNTLLEQGQQIAFEFLRKELGLNNSAADQLTQYLAAAKALGQLPTQKHIMFERFFDETGDMHFIIHSPFGSRVNRAWGLALRKRFCRRFNFELQAAANEDNIVLSLGPTHSFPIEEPAGYCKSATVETILVQALLAAPMFPTRWRWVANTSLAIPRNRAGKKVPAPFQRNDAEDLIAVVFPDQLACFENIAGDREVPDHPLVNQTLYDCLNELMDIEGLKKLLTNIEQGNIVITGKDLATPSPLAMEIINANPYAFLDEAPAEERRTLAIQQRRFLAPEDAADIGRLDSAAVEKVREQAWPSVNSMEELHDALVVAGFICVTETRPHWLSWFQRLCLNKRATQVNINNNILWVAAERLAEVQIAVPDTACDPSIESLDSKQAESSDQALRELVRSRLEVLGPITVNTLTQPLAIENSRIDQALLALQQEGYAIQGNFTQTTQTEWCERGLLARIHRYTLKTLRSEIKPVSPADFMRFLFHWQGLDDRGEGEEALLRTLNQLEGLSLAATVWEDDILPARIQPYWSMDLDKLCNAGRMSWLRLHVPMSDKRKNPAIKTTPIALIERENIRHWRQYTTLVDSQDISLSSNADKIFNVLKSYGASFYQELQTDTGLLPSQLDEGLGELAAWGLVNSDSFQGLRSLITPQKQQRRSKQRSKTPALASGGRWALMRNRPTEDSNLESAEHIALVLLNRYGVVFRKLLEKEQGLPSWRELLYVYRRLEARGEIRGGRFVNGFSGEQFAMPEAINQIRTIRKQDKTDDLISISAADPLNLTGIITPGERIAQQHSHRILYRDGVPLAVAQGKEIRFFEEVATTEATRYKTALLRKHLPSAFHKPPSRLF